MAVFAHPPAISKFIALKSIRKISCLTAYSAPVAAALDTHCDLLLVGDSLAMAVYGLDSTRDVDLDTMIRHGAAVKRRAKAALVIVDLPAGSYEDSPAQALASAERVMREAGADGVKLEGGVAMREQVYAITTAGIPVMGHIGLLPQQANSIKEFRITGRTQSEAANLMSDAKALVDTGVFSIVCEGIFEPVAHKIAEFCSVPPIGIGASGTCDGQILVSDDMLGMFDAYVPKFVHKFADLQSVIGDAAAAYRQAVEDGSFPALANLYTANSHNRKSKDPS